MTRADAQSPVTALARRPGLPRLRPDVVAVVFAGGCVGGWVRYAVSRAWTAPPLGVPWATLAVNLAGAFVLTVVVVLAGELVGSRYLRPLVGTGFCGALTTFSAVVVSTDRLLAHGRVGSGAAYLCLTIVGGLAAGAAGLVAGRLLVAGRRRTREQGSA